MTLRANVLTEEMIQKVVAQYLDKKVALFDKGLETNYSSFDHKANGGYETYEGWHKYMSEAFMSTDKGYEYWLKNHQIIIDIYKENLGRGKAIEVPEIQFDAEDIVTHLGVEARKDSPEFRKLCTELLKATVKAETVIHEHLKGNFETDYDIKSVNRHAKMTHL